MQTKRIEDCFEFIQNGANIKQDKDSGGIPITRIETISNNQFNRDRLGYAGITDASNYSNYILNDNDLLMSHINSIKYLGRTVLYEKQGDELIIHGMNLLRLRAKEKIILPKYATYYFSSNKFKGKILNITKKSVNQASFSIGNLKKIELDLPDTTSQLRITRHLDIIKDIIRKKEQELMLLEELIKARFLEMFGNPLENPNNYPTKLYGDIFKLNAGGTPSKTVPEYWENGTISWVGSNMCQNTVLYQNDGKFISQKGYENSSAKIFPIDTVLVALVGATIGKTALLKFETTTNQNVLGIMNIKESNYNPIFVFYYTQFMYQRFLNIGDGGFNMASKGFISKLPIYVIDVEKQNQFAMLVERINKIKTEIQDSIDKTQLLFDSLMQEYFG